MFRKKFTVELSRILIYAFIAALVYPISAVVTSTFLPSAVAGTPTISRISAADWNASSGAGSLTTSSLYNSGVQTGWKTLCNGCNVDDEFQTVPLGFNTIFNGTSYNTVYVGSNNYITYSAGSSNWSSLSYSNPAQPKLMFGSGDYSDQLIMYRSENDSNTVRIRFEGTGARSGTSGSPTIIWEAIYFKDSSKVFIAIAKTVGGVQGVASASALINQWPDATLSTAASTSAPLYYMLTEGPALVSSGGTTMGTNIGVTLIDTITSSGGIGITTISMDTPTSGASFDPATGVFRLIRADSATFTQTFTAKDSNNSSSSLVVTFVVNALPTNTQTNSTLTTTLGRQAQETMTVAGGTAPFRFVKTSSNSQAGITIETPTARSAVLKVGTTGVVAGTTTETITCTDAVGSVTVAVFTVVINPALSLSNAKGYNVPVTTGTAITETITASNGTSPIRFALSGTVTSGNIYLDTSTAASGYIYLKTLGALSAGTYYETVTATDSRSATSTLGMKLTVTAPAVIGGGATSTFSMNRGVESYDTLTVTGGSVPLRFTLSSSPSNSGISISSFSNTQVVLKFLNTVSSGTYTLTLTSTDSATATTTHTVTLTVSDPISWPADGTTSLTATLGTSKSLAISTSGGFSGKSYTLTQGSNSSNGISLDTSTASSGTVTLRVNNRVALGTYYETITATDSTGRKVATMITVTVVAPIAITRDSVKLTDGYSSLQFNGSSQYLSLPASAKYQVGSTWTAEWWQYQTDSSSTPQIFGLGSNFGFYFSGASLYMRTNSANIQLVSNLVEADRKNKWTHYAIVNNNGSGYVYQNGIAINSTAISMTSVTSTVAPSNVAVCIAVRCSGTTGTGNYYFGGSLTNIAISKRADYSGTSTSTANFTPSTTLKVDSQTVLALIGLNAASNLYDFGTGMDTVTTYNSPVGSFKFPRITESLPIAIETTENRSRAFRSVEGSGGYGDLVFTASPTTSGVQFFARTGYGNFSLTSDVRAVDSVTARVAIETMTATDSNGSQTIFTHQIKINPPLSFTATAFNPVVPALVNYYDTVTAVFGTGWIGLNRSTSPNSGIVISAPFETQTVINIRPSTPAGTYYETITAYDSAGDSETVVIVMTVTPGLSLSATDSATSLTATSGKLNTLQINAQNGSGTKRFTLSHLGTASNFITLDTTTAGSNYVTLKVGNGGTVPAGNYSEQITVTDGAGSSVSLTIAVTVNAAPTISYGGATSGAITLTTTAGTSLTSGAFTAALGTGSRALSLSDLNSGITIDTTTANTAYVTAGSTLNANGANSRSYYDTMTVTDSLAATSIRAFTVVVNPAISLAATSTSLTTTSGVAITDTITASYGTGTKTFVISSSPSIAGITNTANVANQTTLTIPNTVGPGSYTITVSATDSVGATSSINVTLLVNGGVNVTGNSAIAMTTGYAYNSSAYSVSGGTGSYRYVLSGTLSSTYISLETLTATSFRLKMTAATPSGSGVAATYNESVTVTDAAGGKSSFNITLTVNPVVSLTGNQTINTTYGVATTSVYQTSGGTGPYYVLGATLCAPVKTIDGNYTVLSFEATGSCSWVAPTGVENVTALVVGGGGSGDRGFCAYWYGNGGGGGQVKELSTAVTSGTSYNVIVGAGGIKTTNCAGGGLYGGNGRNGDSSTFGSITSNGGRAATVTTPTGGSSYAPDGSVLTGGTHVNAYTNPNYAIAGYPSGGGAGSGGAGSGMNGGAGITSTITGLMYGSGGPGLRYDSAGSALASGTNYSGAQPAGTLPLPNRGAGGSDFTDGGSGVVVLKYLTPSVSDRTRFDIYTDSSTVSSAKIVVSIPDSVTVGTYTQTLTVKDSIPATATYTVTMIISKATPTIGLSLPGGGSSATYGSPVGLTATSSTEGKFTFKKAGSNITGCVDQQTTGGSATCNWTPTDTSTVTMTAAFTPNDTTNYNTANTSNLILTVLQADTLTVTFTNQSLTYSESGTAVSRTFTLSGLSTIDTVTAVATAITGTANDLSSVNVTGIATNGSAGTSTVTKAGTFSLSGTGLTFSGNTKASYYKAIAYSPGTITVNKASNPMTVLYGSANTITYKPTGTETATVTYRGTGAKSFSTSSSTYCTVDSLSGALTTNQAGSCDVLFAVADGPNYFGDTVTATVRINKAARTISAASAAASLKYGETTTVTYLVSAETSTASVSISTGSTTGCSVDISTGTLTAISGTATCTFSAVVGEGTNYLSATSNSVSIALSKANAPVVTLTAPSNVDYSTTATSDSMPLPTFAISGLMLSDTLTALSGITINYLATGTYPYNSTTVPTGANVYTLTPTSVILSTGSMDNYNTPTYSGVSWTINKISQDSLTVKSLFQEGITVPYDIQYIGGSTSGSVTGQILSGGTAQNCSFSGINLRATSSGTCYIQLQMAGNQNYLEVLSDTYTVLIANFTQNIFNFDSLAQGPSGITITSVVPVTKGPESCTSNCQPKITGVSSTSIFIGDPFTITGVNFATATEVIFNLDSSEYAFQIDNDGTSITVIVPADVEAGPGGINVRSPSGLSPMYLGITFKSSNVVG